MTTYKELRELNVNDRVEKKNGLSYLSWAWAWDEFKKAYPTATYRVIKTADGLPYFETDAGVMVFTEVTADGLTHEMWLPVMDGANAAMKREPYIYKTKYGEKNCAAFDMFDVNKTIMRCLVKNLAMFGLAIYIYAGEDLPDVEPVAVDIQPLLALIAGAMDLDTLRTVYLDGVKQCGDNVVAKKALESQKDKRKAELSAQGEA